MKAILVALSTLLGVSASAAVNCTVVDTNTSPAAVPMKQTASGVNTSHKYATAEFDALVTSNADLTNAFILVQSLTAKPRQQVSLFAGKDVSGLLEINIELNGRVIIVSCK